MRRRRRKVAAAAATVLLLPAVAAGEPIPTSLPDYSALADVGRGLVGLTDPADVSADGQLAETDQIGADLLRDAGNPDLLAQEGTDLPTGTMQGIPGVMLQAYQRAADLLAQSQPGCHLHWSLLASIGRIESNHASGGRVFANGDTVRPILGPTLNGGGFAAISDTDTGTFDGDTRWDRAVGAMQFIPSTWRQYASDGNGDRVASPHNVFDAALAAGKYLCSGGLDLANPQQRAVAVFRYNHSDSYVRTVLIWADAYARGVVPLASTPVPTIPPLQQGFAPPVNPSTGQPVSPAPGDGGQVTPPNSTTPTTTPSVPPTCETTTTPTTPPSSSTTTTPTTPTTTPTTPGCETSSTTPTTPTSSTTSPTTSTGEESGTGETTQSTTSESTSPTTGNSVELTSSSTPPSSATESETTSPTGP